MSVCRFLCVVILSLVVCVGCDNSPQQSGIPTEYVEGVVLLDGAPAEMVSVSFFPKTAGKGESAFGTTNAEGKFQLTCAVGVPQKGTLEGEYAVVFSKLEMVRSSINPRDITTMGPPAAGRGGPAGLPPPPKQLLPKVYQDQQKPVFTETVKKGKNSYEFKLESQAK